MPRSRRSWPSACAAGRYTDLLDFCQRVDATRVNKRVLEALVLSGSMDGLAPNRATLMAQLPEAAKAAEQRLRDREAGQVSLFGEFAPGPVAAAARIELPVVADWPLMQRLNGERETLGYFLSGHPTDTCRDWLAQLSTCRIGQVDEVYRPVQGNPYDRRRNEQVITLAGMVAAQRRRGEQMAFVQLEDAGGRVEVAFFREAYLEFAPLLTRDRMLVVEGALMLDEFSGNLQLRAKRAWGLDEACERYARRVYVRLNGVEGDFGAALERRLAAHRPGQTPLAPVVRRRRRQHRSRPRRSLARARDAGAGGGAGLAAGRQGSAAAACARRHPRPRRAPRPPEAPRTALRLL